jgi:hypothetical protein
VPKSKVETVAAIVVLATIAIGAITAAIVGSAENTWLSLSFGLISLFGLSRHTLRLSRMCRLCSRTTRPAVTPQTPPLPAFRHGTE